MELSRRSFEEAMFDSSSDHKMRVDSCWRVRPDARSKVLGELKYLTDLDFPNMLHGVILRSPYPHAKILDISVENALCLPGVRAVLTSQDVPGLNRFGILIQDQPVFCEERVRYVGDAVAAVAADTRDIAIQALKSIAVTYAPLPVVDSLEKALASSSVLLHGSSNILHRAVHCRGNVEETFSKCAWIVENTYQTPRQMHTYMETEGGLFVPEPGGGLTIYAPTQHGYGDRRQVARILGIAEDKIRVVSSPIGGSFGGKDELHVQPYGALLAMATGVPVKIHQSREESVRSGLKRHPMQITMKTGVDSDGKILAHKVDILADTGAYATLGPAVVDFAVEHSNGPYKIPNVEIEGLAIYTNNGVAGEFRGFGGNQVTFALEGQMDRLAKKLGVDPIEIRRRNLRDKDSCGPLGQTIAPTTGALDVLESVANAPLWKERWEQEKRWEQDGQGTQAALSTEGGLARRGIGMAMSMHGGGLGLRRPDDTGGRLSLGVDGKIEVAFGLEECGQGVIASIPIVVSDLLQCSYEDVRVIIGDTAIVPKSGSSTASRATGVVWQTMQKLKKPWTNEILFGAAKLLGESVNDLHLGPGGIWRNDSFHQNGEISKRAHLIMDFTTLASNLDRLPSIETTSSFPATPDTDAPDGAHYLYSFAGVIAEVEVDLLTGEIRVLSLYQSVSAGPVINPMGYLGQIEGGGIMGLGFTVLEEALMEEGQYLTKNLDTYLIPTIQDIPSKLYVDAIEHVIDNDAFGPRGVGEIGTVAVAPAIISAIHHATGHWVSQLPVCREEILQVTEDIREDVFSWR